VEACDIVMDLLDKARQDLDALPSDVDQYTPYLPNPPPPPPPRDTRSWAVDGRLLHDLQPMLCLYLTHTQLAQ
jgi:hypothetical protein